MSADVATLAAELVERSRQGDQNAMATINEVRRSAGQGSAKAAKAFHHIMEYIKKNPFDRFHGEDCCNYQEIKTLIHGDEPLALFDAIVNADCYTAATMLAAGPEIKWRNLGKSLKGRERTVFFHAVRHGRRKNAFDSIELNEREQQIANAGKVYCVCKAIIDVRKPGARIADFSRAVAWELGE